MGDYQSGQPIEIVDTFRLDGVETNPTAIVYTILDPDGATTTYNWPGDAEVTNDSVGHFTLSLAPPALPGTYYYDIDSSGAVVASRSGSFTVTDDATAPTDVDYPLFGPCTPWADASDVWACCGQPMTTVGEGSMAEEVCVDMTQYAVEGSQLLWELSGRIYSGRCETTVRPCRDSCGCWGDQRLSYVASGGFRWIGTGWGSNGTTCGCGCLSRVKLPGYPVRKILEVKIDGDVIDQADYRLDERRYLTSKNGGRWPACQDLSVDDSESGSFSVTYSYGMDAPPLGVAAAAQLGCELYKSCTGSGDCALPSGVVRIVRQGVTIERNAFTAWAFQASGRSLLSGWRTGLDLVDAFLNGANHSGLKRRPAFYSPDAPRYARSVGQ